MLNHVLGRPAGERLIFHTARGMGGDHTDPDAP